MRTVFGIVSLLVALAVVGVLASKQLRAVRPSAAVAVSGSATSSDAATPAAEPSANVRDAAHGIQQRVADDVTKALQQGAARTAEQAQ